MKNLFIHLFMILFLVSFFQSCDLIQAKEKATSNEIAQLQPTSSIAAQTAKARISGEAQLEFNNDNSGEQSPWDFLLKNWGVLALSFIAFLEVGARLTPTEKDNTILKILTTILNAIIPNFKKGGGVF